MRKIVLILCLLLTSFIVVACSSSESQTIVFTDDETDSAIETIKFMCEETAYDSAEIKLKIEQQEELITTNNVLKVIVIKQEDEVINYYKEKVPWTYPEESIKMSLALDTAVRTASENNSKINDFDRVDAVLYSTEEDYKNGNSYAVDVLDLNPSDSITLLHRK